VKISWKDANRSVFITAEGDSDKLLLSVIAKMAEELSVVTEMADGRIKAAQNKMHEATTALAEYQKDTALSSRIAAWFGRIIAKLKGGK
jgi:hypothetical protein